MCLQCVPVICITCQWLAVHVPCIQCTCEIACSDRSIVCCVYMRIPAVWCAQQNPVLLIIWNLLRLTILLHTINSNAMHACSLHGYTAQMETLHVNWTLLLVALKFPWQQESRRPTAALALADKQTSGLWKIGQWWILFSAVIIILKCTRTLHTLLFVQFSTGCNIRFEVHVYSFFQGFTLWAIA